MRQGTLFRWLLIPLILVVLVQQPMAAEPESQRSVVHPMVWDTLREEGQAEILVVLQARGDLSAAAALDTKEAKGRYVYETLRTVATKSQQSLRSELDAQGVDYQGYYIVNALKVRADSAQVGALARRSDVERIVPNPSVRGVPAWEPIGYGAGSPRRGLGAESGAHVTAPDGIESNLVRVNADDVWALGYTGQGIVVAGQDTGYDWDHAALKATYRGWNGTEANHDYNWHDAIHDGGGRCGPDSAVPCDDSSHGTHTMGIMVGDDGAGHRIGVAPGAKWMGCRNMDVGYGTPATYIECFEFFLAPYPVGGTPAQGDPGLAPDVVNNSWSCPPSEGCDAETLEAAVDAMRQAGIVIAVSAGNEGPDCSSMESPPAIYQQAFTVGGLDHWNDAVYNRSSRGPVTYGSETYIKPDISAPAVSINSSMPDGQYGRMTGTSMAAPHVAGAAALLLSATPGASGDVEAIEGILTRTAEPRYDGQCGDSQPPNNVWGWGILDALAAVESVTSGQLEGRVQREGNREAVGAARILASLDGWPGVRSEAWSGSTGYYSLTLPAGRYDLLVEADSYLPQTVSDVQVVRGMVTTQDLVLIPLFRFHLPYVYRESWKAPAVDQSH